MLLARPAVTALGDLNAADESSFVAALGGIFEHSPWIAARAWRRRPFADAGALYGAMCAVLESASHAEKIALIAAHPDLVGQAALAGTLTAASQAEQAAAGLDRLSDEEIAMFTALNAAYRDRFGFPFVICVRENRKAAIVEGLRTRVRNDRATEIAIALDEIAKIARLRLADAVAE